METDDIHLSFTVETENKIYKNTYTKLGEVPPVVTYRH